MHISRSLPPFLKTTSLLLIGALFALSCQAVTLPKESGPARTVALFETLCVSQLPDLDSIVDFTDTGGFVELTGDELAAYQPQVPADMLRVWRFFDFNVEFRLLITRSKPDAQQQEAIPEFAQSDLFNCSLMTPEGDQQAAVLEQIEVMTGRPPDDVFEQEALHVDYWEAQTETQFVQVMHYASSKQQTTSLLSMTTFVKTRESSTSPQTLSGDWTGSLQGVAMSVQLNQEARAVSGTVLMDDYPYRLSLNLNGTQAEGALIDPQTGAQVPSRIALNGDVLEMQLFLQGLGMGPTIVTLSRSAPRAPASPTYAESREDRSGAQDASIGYVDPLLVGTWTMSTSYTSGDFSAATQNTYTLYADGRYMQGAARVAGGGSMGTFDSGRGTSGATGQWTTQNRVLYLNDGAGWYPVAPYYIEANKLLLKANTGNQIWYRQ
jgi:hypothetical protein